MRKAQKHALIVPAVRSVAFFGKLQTQRDAIYFRVYGKLADKKDKGIVYSHMFYILNYLSVGSEAADIMINSMCSEH